MKGRNVLISCGPRCISSMMGNVELHLICLSSSRRLLRYRIAASVSSCV